MTIRDSHYKTLEEYPRPSVAVDTAVLTVTHELCVALVSSEGEVRLPGTFLHPGELLEDAALRALRTKAGIDGLAPRQLHVFDSIGRDDRGWVLSVAHVDVVPAHRLGSADLTPVNSLPHLKYDHGEIVARAVAHVRLEYRERPDPSGLLVEPFTIRALHILHEAVAGDRLMRDSFRRAMLPHLEATGAIEEGTVGKPAALYRRAR